MLKTLKTQDKVRFLLAVGLGLLCFALLAACCLPFLAAPHAEDTQGAAGRNPAPDAKAAVAPAAQADAAAQRAGAELAVQNILQYPELPNGCEATSLAMLLNYLGFDADKLQLAREFIPAQPLTFAHGVAWGPDPRVAYAGNPEDSTGYYILAPGLAEGANRYLAARGGLVAASLAGAGEDELVAQLQAGRPVIVWATMDFGPAQYAQYGWMTAPGEEYIPYANLHCMVLVGYSEASFTLCNPLRAQRQTVARSTFLEGYLALGAQAVVIQ